MDPTTFGLDEVLDPVGACLVVVDIQNDHVSPGGAKDRAGHDLSMTPGVVASGSHDLRLHIEALERLQRVVDVAALDDVERAWRPRARPVWAAI
jgi:nicotinamidase-related amidase